MTHNELNLVQAIREAGLIEDPHKREMAIDKITKELPATLSTSQCIMELIREALGVVGIEDVKYQLLGT